MCAGSKLSIRRRAFNTRKSARASLERLITRRRRRSSARDISPTPRRLAAPPPRRPAAPSPRRPAASPSHDRGAAARSNAATFLACGRATSRFERTAATIQSRSSAYDRSRLASRPPAISRVHARAATRRRALPTIRALALSVNMRTRIARGRPTACRRAKSGAKLPPRHRAHAAARRRSARAPRRSILRSIRRASL